jgi:alkylation response protein AidB-like acyl-CoA dehydrogenase
MDWSDTGEQEQFRVQVRDFIEERLPELYRERSKRGKGPGLHNVDWQFDLMLGEPEVKAAALEWAEALAERGWSAPHWPPEYGGAGLTSMEQFIFKQELARAGAPVVGGPGASMLGPTLIHHGTEEQRREFLPKTLSGEITWAQGYSEPGAGSDLASLATRAVRDGDDYVINGQKIWTSMGHKANWFFMLVRTDPDAPKHRGISFLLLRKDTPGVEVRPLISGGWEHATNESFYEDVRVPISQRIGEENRGWYVAMTLLDYERSNITGAVDQRKDLDELIEYLGTDEGKRRSRTNTHDSTRALVTTRYIETEVLAQFAMRIISMQHAGQIPNYEASMSKVFGGTLLQEVQQTGMKVFGLYGGLWDPNDECSPLNARYTQKSVHTISGSIAGGTHEIQRNIIASRGLGLPRG